jgi:uncharacterized protein
VSAQRREPLPDALRALALLGVLIVNAAGYHSSPWGPVLGAQAAQAGGTALALQAFYAFGVQGKAYPILTFLFGMGLVLAQRRQPRAAAQLRARSRTKRLLLLGVLHGLLIYFGDILTMYALIGWLVSRHVPEPWAVLRRRLRRALFWALGFAAVLGLVVTAGLLMLPADEAAVQAEPAFATVANWPEFWMLNASGYVFMQAGMLVTGFALLRLLMLTGIAAARLRWLTHPRWHQQRQRLLRRWAVPALLLNALYALGYVHHSANRDLLGLVEVLGFTAGPLLSMVLVLAFAQHAQRSFWLPALEPLGQRTLTLYVGHSLLCLLLFSGVGLALQPGIGGLLVFSLLLWCAAWLAARASGAWRWPLEAWMARR